MCIRDSLCNVARSVVNIQHSTGFWLFVFLVWCHHLHRVNKSSDAHFWTLFSKIFLFFDVPQYSNRFNYINERWRAIYVNNQKNHCISPLKALLLLVSVDGIFCYNAVKYEVNLAILLLLLSGMSYAYTCWNISHHILTMLSPNLVKLVTFDKFLYY